MKTKLQRAIESTPFYHNIMTFDLSQYPIITKRCVVDNMTSFRSSLPMQVAPITVATSGSSGTPLQITWDTTDYFSSLLEVWRKRKELGVYPNDRFVSSHVLFSNSTSFCSSKLIIHKNNLSLSKLYSDEETLMQYYKTIMDFEPCWMMLPPSFLYGFSCFLQKRGLSFPTSVILIELTGEYCPRPIFDYFLSTYPHIKWKILYGMQEFNVIAYGDLAGLEILDQNVHVEIINANSKAALPNEEGAIVVTGLKNCAMPLIRYQTEDYGYIDNQGKLHITRARSNDKIKVNNHIFDGSIFWLVILMLKQSLNLPILQFQVILEDNTLFFYLVVDENVSFDKSTVNTIVEDILRKEFNIDFSVDLSIVKQISTAIQGNKVKYFINRNPS